SLRKRSRRPERSLKLSLEQLEDRVTPAATLTISGTDLLYTGSSVNNNLSISVAGGTYTFNDTAEVINVVGSGATGSGSNTVTIADSFVSSIAVNTADGTDTINIRSINDPTTVAGGNGNDTVNVSSNGATLTGNLAGIAAPLTVNADAGADKLCVSDFAASTGNGNVVVDSGSITGFAGSGDNVTIQYSTTGGTFSLVRLIGSNSPTLPEVFTVNNPSGPVQLDGNAGNDTADVQALSAATTVNMGAGNDVVNVSSDAPANLGNLDGINGTLTIDGGTGSNALNVSDFGTAGPANSAATV